MSDLLHKAQRWDRKPEPEGRAFNRRLGKIIAGLREERGITQAQLAARIGLSHRESVSNIETGDRMVRAWDLCQIAQVFGVPITTLTDAAYVSMMPADVVETERNER